MSNGDALYARKNVSDSRGEALCMLNDVKRNRDAKVCEAVRRRRREPTERRGLQHYHRKEPSWNAAMTRGIAISGQQTSSKLSMRVVVPQLINQMMKKMRVSSFAERQAVAIIKRSNHVFACAATGIIIYWSVSRRNMGSLSGARETAHIISAVNAVMTIWKRWYIRRAPLISRNERSFPTSGNRSNCHREMIKI